MALSKEFRKGDSITIAPKQGVYEISSTQKAPLGTRIAFADGRVFRYALNGAAELAPGKLVVTPALTAANYLNKQCTAAAIGAYTLTVVTGAAGTQAQFGDGFLQVNDGTGEGIQYKVKKVVANATTATSTDVTLYDPIATALVASGTSEVSLIANPYYQLIVTSANTENVIGIPPVTVTAAYYFWVQTWGWAICLSEGTPAAGTVIQYGYGTGGTTTKAAHGVPTIGQQLYVGVAAEYKPIYLMIQP